MKVVKHLFDSYGRIYGLSPQETYEARQELLARLDIASRRPRANVGSALPGKRHRTTNGLQIRSAVPGKNCGALTWVVIIVTGLQIDIGLAIFIMDGNLIIYLQLQD